MPERILVVDDEREIADLVALYLSGEGYEAHAFYYAEEALAAIEKGPFDLAILDVMMPGMDGFALCRHIRKAHTYPIIMLTAKDAEIDKINGLALGADDYVTKPFRPLELVARVKAQLRRYKRYNDAPDRMRAGGICIDLEAHLCTLDDQPLSLTPTEFTILHTLAKRQGQVVSAEALFHAVWGDEYYDKNNNTITVHIRHLREKLGETVGTPRHIKTVWGVGYKIEAE